MLLLQKPAPDGYIDTQTQSFDFHATESMGLNVIG
jgi:hypothetical protein